VDARGRVLARVPYLLLDGGATAVVESATVCGLAQLAAGERDPMRASTYGLGQLIAHVCRTHASVTTLLVGLGGSATNDVGLGMLQALGARIVLADGSCVPADRPVTGADLQRVQCVDLGDGCGEAGAPASASDAAARPAAAAAAPLRDIAGRVRVRVLSDVRNPLCGPDGAARVFAPQKGARSDDVERLDAGTACVARALQAALRRRSLAGAPPGELELDVATFAGGGAAGGLGAGLMVGFPGAQLRSGIEAVAEVARLSERVARADLVLTGEGRLDAQTAGGKVVSHVLALCAAHRVPCVVLCGAIEAGAAQRVGAAVRADAAVLFASVSDAVGAAESLGHTAAAVRRTAQLHAREWFAVADAARAHR
jgi:glycerate kinase